MSVYGSHTLAFLALASGAIADSTSRIGAIAVSELHTQDLPNIQVFDLAMSVASVLVFRQEDQRFGFTCMIVDDVTQEQMLLHYDAIVTDLAADRTLTSTVRWCSVSSWGLWEVVDEGNTRAVLMFEVVIEVIV